MHELMNTTKEVFGKIEKNGEQGQAAKNQAQENLKYDGWRLCCISTAGNVSGSGKCVAVHRPSTN